MSKDIDDIEELFDTESNITEDSEVHIKAKSIVKRSEAVGFKAECEIDSIFDIYLEINYPSGRSSRTIFYFEEDNILKLEQIEFEKYNFVENYDAIFSIENQIIEALIRPAYDVAHLSISKSLFSKKDSLEELVVSKSDDKDAPRITIGHASAEFKAVYSYCDKDSFTLKLENFSFANHDQCKNVLETISNSVFFQIDSIKNFTLVLSRLVRKSIKLNKKASIEDVQYPKYEFENAPISLYWYARSAIGMPLLQFLAFYQVLEFYFPIYAQAEAQRKIRSILKDPAFKVDRDFDLSRLINFLKGKSAGLGDEKSQLKATLLECVNAAELREFLTGDKNRFEFFTESKRGITNTNLSIKNDKLDLREEVSERVYKIRCKIVHTKSDHDGEIDLLLPNSEEALKLKYEIELMQFLAQKILIYASTPLSIL